jgi:hypothetical protein
MILFYPIGRLRSSQQVIDAGLEGRGKGEQGLDARPVNQLTPEAAAAVSH